MPDKIRPRLIALCAISFAFAGAIHCSLPIGKGCTLLACFAAATVELEYTEAGAYEIDVEVEGAVSKCKIDTASDRRSCVGGAKVVAYPPRRSDAGAPATIGSLVIDNSRVTTVRVQVRRDGAVLHDKSVPVTWTTSSGPNGPDCDPEGCRSGRATFPGA